IQGKGQLKSTVKFPILLFLRDLSQIIKENPEYELAQAIYDQLIKSKVSIPPDWFTDRLNQGKVLIMLDGLDEVTDPVELNMVEEWIERQIDIWQKYKNRFIITSRPHAYRSNPLSHVNLLEVLPLDNEQINCLIQNWYLANEIANQQKEDPGIRMLAIQESDDLQTKLQSDPNLLELAVNPWLLTMMMTVNRYRESLPKRRVELYQEICEAFLGAQPQSQGVASDFTPAQTEVILQPLAYHLTCGSKRDISLANAKEVIREPLHLINPNIEAEEFLKMIETSSGFLSEGTDGVYRFAHLTFQEYLTAVFVKEQNKENELIARIEEPWWHEVIRLYSANSNATEIMKKCLELADSSVTALLLAIELMNEALGLESGLLSQFENLLFKGIEDPDPERRRLVAGALLSLRLRRMTRITDEKYMDSSNITYAEYQLFVDEMRTQGNYYQPDHWLACAQESYQFPIHKGAAPVVGVRPFDAIRFCDWLTLNEGGNWEYRIPSVTEIPDLNQATAPPKEETAGYWCKRDWDIDCTIKSKIGPELLFERIEQDLLICLEHNVSDQKNTADRVSTLVNQFDLSGALDTPRACAFGDCTWINKLDSPVTLSYALDRLNYQSIAFDQEAFLFEIGLDDALNTARGFDSVQTLGRARAYIQAVEIAIAMAKNLTSDHDFTFTLTSALDSILGSARKIARSIALTGNLDLKLIQELDQARHQARDRAQNLALEFGRNFGVNHF
ncbi:MAG TPA: NACHT domain-containing protein, partial [Bacillota bacterium]|nr:NACHT domain-containing protein [Bacillota bacterium]